MKQEINMKDYTEKVVEYFSCEDKVTSCCNVKYGYVHSERVCSSCGVRVDGNGVSHKLLVGEEK